MLLLRLALLVMIALSGPKAWQKAQGVSPRQFSRTLSTCHQCLSDASAFEALSQPYYYRCKGSQFYVFFSADNQYVLKIPRASKMRESLTDRVMQRSMSKPDVKKSLQIAEQLKEETALIAVHYGQMEQSIWPAALLYDHLHRSWIVDLNQLPFALQKRQQLLSASLQSAADIAKSQQLLMAYLDLIQKEASGGWMSHDRAFWLNVGIDGLHATRIDLGSYVPIDASFSWRRMVKPVSHYLRDKDPILKEWFEKQLDQREHS
ncbi:MAG: hypothetical protein HW387_13 [Parachlamydiales bacterium]|nr:hypothetical protein [Parachlamydiales bacterium]